MIWTKELPKKAGWWWFRDVPSQTKPDILYVFWEAPWGKDHEYGGYWAWVYGYDTDDFGNVEHLPGEWSSEPIPEPEEQPT